MNTYTYESNSSPAVIVTDTYASNVDKGDAQAWASPDRTMGPAELVALARRRHRARQTHPGKRGRS